MKTASVSGLGLLAVLVPALVLSMQLMGVPHELGALFQAVFAYGLAGLIAGAAAGLIGLGWRGWLLFAVAVVLVSLGVAFVRDSRYLLTGTVLATLLVLIPATVTYVIGHITQAIWGRLRAA